MDDFEWDDFDNPTYEDDYDDEDEVNQTFQDLTSDLPEPPQTGEVITYSQTTRLLQDAVNDFYDKVVEKWGISKEFYRDPNQFELVDGKLQLKDYPEVQLYNKRTGDLLALSTIKNNLGTTKTYDILSKLGFDKIDQKLKAKAALQNIKKELNNIDVENIPLENLGESAAAVFNSMQEIETSFINNDTMQFDPDQVVSGTNYPYRELVGFDKRLQTWEGEYNNNLVELLKLNGEISRTENMLKQDLTEEERNVLTKNLEKLKDERQPRLELANSQRDELRTQINHIRQTIDKVLNQDKTLAERVRTLFREQGITIASILTAIGMVVSTLVLALTGGGTTTITPSPSPTPSPADKPGLKEWVKKHLQALGRALAKLAGKAAAALPGIIGSIVSWLLGLLGKAASWLAENTFTLVLAVGGLLLLAVKKHF